MYADFKLLVLGKTSVGYMQEHIGIWHLCIRDLSDKKCAVKRGHAQTTVLVNGSYKLKNYF